MAGNTRGKIKEKLLGIHNNAEWIRSHSLQAADMMGDHHPDMVELFVKLSDMAQIIDDAAQKLYGVI